MKLYTEEEVIRAIELSDGQSTDEVLAGLTPIELPSDEEIITEVSRSNLGLGYDFSMFIGFKQGAKYVINYVINKIQGGNND